MGKTLSIKLTDDQVERLGEMAQRYGQAPSTLAAVLIEEALREEEFRYVEFRDNGTLGREGYVWSTLLKMWQLPWLDKAYGGDRTKIAKHLKVSVDVVDGAYAYVEVYRDEVDVRLAEASKTFEEVQEILPNIQRAW